MIGMELLQHCAPQVAPVTMAAIVQAESGGHPWAIYDNRTGRRYYLKTKTEAVAIAKQLIAAGHKLDMGIGQVDSANLRWLHLSVDQVFDPCTNLQAAQKILLGAYKQAGGSLQGALQAYNSGNTTGDRKYVAAVYRQAGVTVPPIPGGRLAPWTAKTIGGPEEGAKGKEEEVAMASRPMPPVRLKVTWTPEGSPLSPNSGELDPTW